MLRKVSLILLCGWVTLPIQSLHAKTCADFFEKETVNESSISDQSNLDQVKTHPIRNELNGTTLNITRKSSEFEILNREARRLFDILTRNARILISETDPVLKEYSPINSFNEIATGISEAQMSFLDARGRDSTIAQEGAQNLKERINGEINQIKRKIIETENLTYKLDMIIDLVRNLSQNKKYERHVNLYNSLFRLSLSRIKSLKENLEILEAFKRDLISVIKTQALQPSEINHKFYNSTEIQAKDDLPMTRTNVKFPTQSSRQFRHTLGDVMKDVPKKLTPEQLKERREQLQEEDKKKSKELAQIRKGEGPRTTIVAAPDYRKMTGSTVGVPAIRGTSYANPVNSGRGVMSGSYATKSGLTGKVDLNSQARHMILTMDSKASPVEMIQKLRQWIEDNDLKGQMTVYLNADSSISLAEKIKGSEERKAKKLQELRDDFRNENLDLINNPNPPERIQPELPKPLPPEKPPTFLDRVLDVLNYNPRLN